MAILMAVAGMFVVLSCYGESMQFNNGFGFHQSSQSCEEHISQPGDVHTDKCIFDGVVLPEGNSFAAALLIVAFFVLFPTFPERYNRSTKISRIYNRLKRWVWAKNLPFSFLGFFPYFAAIRDY